MGSVGLFAGCLGNDADRPDPISLEDGGNCDYCGMVLESHSGSKGQAFYGDDVPEAHDGPAWFCSGTCTYNYVFDQEDVGLEPTAIYLTDYSAVEYSLSSENGEAFISAHLTADVFSSVEDLAFAVGSDVYGAMGPDLVGFGDRADAEAFVDEHGGELYEHDDVSRELLSTLDNYRNH
ncbi:nitrous oxide reductase accessory protein NosL [Halobacteria archaeon AArc-m2/3/4]|uniref:Nitrous oxide reductase accessory protein NosL n=1 Tax=Natronoglomus mannanivorans TaxID=2979990 RepID=A0AAP3E3I6_9EURY|nr:nitrous oxide reductase accessory protein NosL [Halobacteria archaeon AArc-xg1-1]MCU4975817.1 nitrous oxide reductase accessory protein NosL [Halobacteria archaeon AArc-m2/3/4]